MATTIDSRVVEMRFDNQDFEKNASATLNVLKNLDKSLNGIDAVKGLGNITDAANKADLSVLERGVETVKQKFSALEVIAVGALMKIGSTAVDTATRTLKSFTVDPIIQGWDRYAQKTSAVQTIMGATAQQFSDTAVQMEAVEEQLEKLSWFTDETSFRFVDMVDNIGKFTSAGVGLDDSVKSMQGINLWAAKSGATVDQASRAMYNLSQAMSMGKLTIMDWKSIENANMATIEFKQSAIDLAKEMGVLKDAGDGFVETMKGTRFSAAKGFRDSLTEGWLNDQVMTATFNKYSEFSEKMFAATEDTGLSVATMLDYVDDYKDGVLDIDKAVKGQDASIETFTEHLKILSDEGMEFSRTAFEMAQEAKTFSEAIEYVGEAVSSGWMRTFELIFGNYVEAKELWSGFAEELYEIFVKGGEERNRILKEWKDLGGRTDLFQGIANIWKTIKSTIESVKAAWDRVFPPTEANTLVRITKAFADFTSYLVPSKTVLENISTLFEGLFSILKTGVNIVKAVFHAFKPLLTLFVKIAAGLGSMALEAGALFGKSLIKAEEVIRKVVFALAKLINYILTGVTKIPVLQIAVYGLSKAFEFLSNGARAAFEGLKNIIANTKIGSALSSIGTDLTKIFEHLQFRFDTGGLKGLFTGLLEAYEEVIFKIKENKTFNNIANTVKPVLNTVLSAIKNFAFLVIGALAGIVNFIKDGGIGKAIHWLVDDVIWLGGVIYNAFKNIDLEAVIGKIQEYILKARDGFQKFIEKLREFASQITVPKIAAIGFSLALLALATSIIKIGDAFTQIGGLAGTIKTKIVTPFQSLLPKISPLLQFSIAVISVSKALKMLSEVPAEDLKKVVASISTLTIIVGGVVGLLSVVTSKFGGGVENLKGIGQAMIGFGVGIGAVVAAMAILGAVETSFDHNKITAVVATILAMGTIMAAMTVLSGSKSTMAPVKMLAFAGSVAIVVGCLKQIGDLEVGGKELLVRVGALTMVMAGLAILGAAVSQIKIGSAIGVMVLAQVLKDVMPAIKEAVSSISIDQATMDYIDKNKEFIIAVAAIGMVISTVLVAALVQLSKQLNAITRGLIGLALAVSLLGMVSVAIKNAEFSTDDLIKIGAFLGSFMVLITAFALITKSKEGQEVYKSVGKLAGLIVVITGAIALLSGLAVILGQIDIQTLATGAAPILALGLMFAALAAATRLSKDAKPAALIAAVVGVIALCAEMIVLSFIPFQQILPGMASLVAVMLALTAVFKSISGAKIDTKALILLGEMVVILAATTGALMVISRVPWQQLLAAAAAMSGTLVALALAMKLVNNLTQDINPATVALLIASVVAVGSAIALISLIPWQQALGAAAGLALVMVSLGVMAKLLSGISLDFQSLVALAASVGALMVVTVALAGLIPVFQEMANISWESLAKGGVTLLGLTAALLVLSNVGTQALVGVVGLAAIVGVLALMIPIFNSYAGIDWETMGKAGATLVALGAALIILSKVGTDILLAAAAMAAMAATMLIMAVACNQFSTVEWETMGKAGIVLAALAAVLALLGALGPVVLAGSAALIIMAASLIGMAAAVAIMAAVNLDGVAGNIARLAAAIALLGAVGAVIGMFSPMLLMAAAAIAALAGAVALANVVVAKGMGSLATVMAKAGEVIAKVAVGIAKAILTPLSALVQPIIAIGGLIGKGFETGFRDGIGFHSPIPWIDALFSTIKGQFGGFFADGEIANGAAQWGGGIKDAISGAIGDGGDVMGQLTDSMGGLVGMGGDLTSMFGDLSGSGLDLSSMLQQLNGDFDIGAFGTELFNGQLTNTASAADGASAALGGTAEKTKILASEAQYLTAEELQGLEIVNDLGGGLLDLNGKLDASSEAYRNLKEAVTNSFSVFDEFQEKTAITGQEMINNMQAQIDHMQGWADNITSLAERGIDEGLLQKLVDMGPEGSAHVAAFASMTDEQLKQATELWAQSLTLPDQVTQQVASSFEQLGKDIADGTNNGLEENMGKVGDTLETGTDNALKRAENIAETNSPSERTKRMGKGIMDGLAIGLKGPGFVNVMTTITQTSNKMVQEFKNMAKKIIDGFGESFKNSVNVMINAIKNGFNRSKKTATDAMQALIKDVKKTADNTVTSCNFESVGTMIVDHIARGISSNNSAKTNMASCISAVHSTAVSTVNSSNFASIGTSIAEGVAKGIASSNAIQNAARQAVQNAKIAAQQEAQINSPSKLFMNEVGAPIAEGIANGIRLYEDMAEKAARDLMVNIYTTMDYINEVFNGEVDINPVITPTIDLSRIKTGMSSINRAFERYQGIKNVENRHNVMDDTLSGVTKNYTFNQYNNSPKALSRTEIYRDTKNLLSAARS